MAHVGDFTYSPSNEDGDDSHSVVSTSDRTVDDLQSAYERRQAVTERQTIAVTKWRKKLIFSACLLIITSGFLIFSEVWYANVVGIAGAALGIYGAAKKNTEFIFVYMVLLGLEFVKNIGIFIYYINQIRNNGVTIPYLLLVVVCLLEELGIVPLSMYYAFKLYRSLNLVNDDEVF